MSETEELIVQDVLKILQTIESSKNKKHFLASQRLITNFHRKWRSKELELTEIAIIENQYNTLTEYNKMVMLKRLQ